jgi:hypothetical protein
LADLRRELCSSKERRQGYCGNVHCAQQSPMHRVAEAQLSILTACCCRSTVRKHCSPDAADPAGTQYNCMRNRTFSNSTSIT